MGTKYSLGDIIQNVTWTCSHTELVSTVKIVKINPKTLRVKILTCYGPLWMRGRVRLGEIITIQPPHSREPYVPPECPVIDPAVDPFD